MKEKKLKKIDVTSLPNLERIKFDFKKINTLMSILYLNSSRNEVIKIDDFEESNKLNEKGVNLEQFLEDISSDNCSQETLQLYADALDENLKKQLEYILLRELNELFVSLSIISCTPLVYLYLFLSRSLILPITGTMDILSLFDASSLVVNNAIVKARAEKFKKDFGEELNADYWTSLEFKKLKWFLNDHNAFLSKELQNFPKEIANFFLAFPYTFLLLMMRMSGQKTVSLDSDQIHN